jgi:hypothetical protein
VELFDIFIFLGVLLAMLFSSQPKKTAMAICLAVSLFGLGISAGAMYYQVPDMIYPLQAVNETCGALLILALSRQLQERKEKNFFMMMAGLLVMSSALNSIYPPIYIRVETMTFTPYLVLFKTIAVLHVFTMLMFADGITNLARSIRDNLLRRRFTRSNM